ncbi:MATE family efflux transporter [Caulobacter sp. NIBR2454]|uniref:MATE family efflux transporter n=1 Tax=Caulobacter sp. NIBR2454 TaxID=3015996 RepID=UPI002FC3CD58
MFNSLMRADLSALLRLAGPVILARLGIMVMGLTDAIVVGHFSAQQLAFHALGWAPTAAIVTTGVGLLAGVQVMTARRLGEGRRAETGAILRRGIVYAFWVGMIATVGLILLGPPMLHALKLEAGLADGASAALLVFALSLTPYLISVAATYYLEALSRPGPGLAIMWIANGLNLALNLLLVPGVLGIPAWGAVGSAWATFGSRVFLMIAMLICVFGMKEARALGVFRRAPREPGAAAEQRKVGYGAGASYFVESGAFAAMSIFAGMVGGAEVAAWAIVLNVAALIFMVPLGLSTATGVLVGTAYGARDRAGVERAGILGGGVALLAGTLISFIVWPTAGPIARAYTSDPGLLALTAPAIVLACLFFTADAVQVVAAQALRARGDVLVPTITHVIAYAAIMTPLAWFLAVPMGMGLNGIVWGVIAASLAAAVFLCTRFEMLIRRDSF